MIAYFVPPAPLQRTIYEVRKVLEWQASERPPTGTIRNNNKDKTDKFQEQSTNNLGLQTYKLGGATDYLLRG